MDDYKITINNSEWDIKFVEYILVEDKNSKNTFEIQEVDNYEPQQNEEILGICDNDNKVIAVATEDVSDNEIKTTLLHELVHAVAKEYNIDIPEVVVEEIGKIMFKTYCRLNSTNEKQ